MRDEHVHRLQYEDKEILLIATAHVSRHSAEEVRRVIEEEKPDSICIELDEGRYKSLKEKDKWRNTDLIQVIKDKKVGYMFANILLSNYQRKIAEQFNISAGQEMIQGIKSSEETGAHLVLADRNIQTTFTRVWRGVSFWGKMKLLTSIVYSLIDDEEITEEDLEQMKGEDMLTSAMSEMGKAFPGLKTYLVDERDQYLANKIKNAPGKKIVAVLGAAHVLGIKEEIYKEQDMERITEIPPKSFLSKIAQWFVPMLIVALILFTFSVDSVTGIEQLKSWLIWNSSMSALGTIIALGHPLAVVVSFLLAPMSALHPLVAVGWFSGIIEAHYRKPKVEDFEDLAKDLSSIKGLWKNKVTRVLLVVIFANLGSVFGTIISGVDIVNSFVNTIF